MQRECNELLPGVFVISLDFELQYGIEDHDEAQIQKYHPNILGARKAVKDILFQFQQYGIHATWAIVGMLLARNRSDLAKYIPEKKPQYQDKKLSIYSFLNRIGKDEKDDPAHYGLSLAKAIRKVEGQEIASHTFSHYYCCYPGQDGQDLQSDMGAAQNISEQNLGVKPTSVIFPRNQINTDYIPILKEMGFTAYRGWPSPSVYNTVDNGYWIRGRRLLDSYFSLYGAKAYPRSEVPEQGIANIKASNFLRPYNRRLRFMEKQKISQIRKGMLEAAVKKQVYHLWWHPHNFGAYREANLSNLDRILSYYCYLSMKYDFSSMNMGELAMQVLGQYI